MRNLLGIAQSGLVLDDPGHIRPRGRALPLRLRRFQPEWKRGVHPRSLLVWGGPTVVSWRVTRRLAPRPGARMPRTIVVIPTYNEAENLPLIVPKVLEQDTEIEVSRGRRRVPRRARASSRTTWRSRLAACTCFTEARAGPWVRPTGLGWTGPSSWAPIAWCRWMPTSRTPPRRCPS